MSWLGKIFPCWGPRAKGGCSSLAAQHGSKTNQDSDELTDFVGDMPLFEEVKPEPYYVNGVENQTVEKKPINPDSDSLLDQVTVVESIHTATPDHHEYLHFCGSTNAIPAEPSGKLMAIFTWTSKVSLDTLELLDCIPGSNKESGLVERIICYNHFLIPIIIPSQYAEQRQCQSHHSGASPIETQIKKTATDHRPGNQDSLLCSTRFLPLPPTPPTPTPIEATDPAHPRISFRCPNLEAFAAWTHGPSQLQKTY